MAPVPFFVTGTALQFGCRALLIGSVATAHEGLLGSTWQMVGPYFLSGLLALISQLVVRGLGSKRRLRSTLAMAFYVTNGPILLFGLFLTLAPMSLALRLTHAPSPEEAPAYLRGGAFGWLSAWMTLGGIVMLVLYTVYSAKAASSVHRVSTWKTGLLTSGALVVILVGWSIGYPSIATHLGQPAPSLDAHVSEGAPAATK